MYRTNICTIGNDKYSIQISSPAELDYLDSNELEALDNAIEYLNENGK